MNSHLPLTTRLHDYEQQREQLQQEQSEDMLCANDGNEEGVELDPVEAHGVADAEEDSAIAGEGKYGSGRESELDTLLREKEGRKTDFDTESKGDGDSGADSHRGLERQHVKEPE